MLTAQLPKKLQPLFFPKRYKVLYGGRGASKSWGVARALLIRGAERKTRVLCAREIQRTISDSVHRLLADQIEALGLQSHYRVTDNEISGINGTIFLFAGLRQQDAGKIKSFEGVDICWVEEAQAVSKRSWDILIPTIRKEGSEIWVTFNPELDSDDTYTRFIVNTPPGTELININWRDNPWFPETLLKEKQHLEQIDPTAYANVWEGKCRASVDGAIYASEIADSIEKKRIRPLPYDPLLKVHTVWDLGWNDKMSIGFFQRLHSEIRCIDFLENNFKTYDWYTNELRNKGYNYGLDFLPHDGGHKNEQTGMSAVEILRKLGRKVAEPLPRADVEEGIKAVRLVFPQIYFDDVKTVELVNHIKRYRRAIPTTTNEPQGPLHDEHSHAADMLRYMAQAIPQMTNDEKQKPIVYPKLGIV